MMDFTGDDKEIITTYQPVDLVVKGVSLVTNILFARFDVCIYI